MSNKKIVIGVLFILALVMPSMAYANAMIPALQFFNSFLFLPSLILFAIIVIFETMILNISIKYSSFSRNLLFATIINLASSITGSFLPWVYNLAFLEKFLRHHDLISLALLPFLLTCIVEYPIILLLYKKTISKRKALWITCVMNVVSYVILIALIQPLFVRRIAEMRSS